jgi:hypothetical protein
MKFYSVILKKSIEIPKNKIKKVMKKGRRFLVGEYMVNKKKQYAWRITSAEDFKKF